MAEESSVKIVLTPEQQEQVKKASGKRVTTVELKPEILECRIAPGRDLQ